MTSQAELPAEADSNAPVGDLDLVPRDVELMRSAISSAFADPEATALLLDRVGFPASHTPVGLSPRERWPELFRLFSAGIIDRPHRQLLAAALKIYPRHPALLDVAIRHGLIRWGELPPGDDTCHLILDKRQPDAEIALREHGLELERVWSTPHTTSLKTDYPDDGPLRATLRELRIDGLVIGPGQPDYLLHSLHVVGPDGRRFRVEHIGSQQAVADVAQQVIHGFYPSDAPDGSSNRLVFVHLVPASGQARRIDPELTIHDAGVVDSDLLHLSLARPEVDSVAFDLRLDTARHSVVRIRAMIDPIIPVGEEAILSVTVSPESVGGEFTRSPDTDKQTEFNPQGDSDIQVEVREPDHLSVVGIRRQTVRLPVPGDQARTLTFRIRAEAPGRGTIEIPIIQGNYPHRLLTLHPRIASGALLHPLGNTLYVYRTHTETGSIVYQYYLTMTGEQQPIVFNSDPLRPAFQPAADVLTRIGRYWAGGVREALREDLRVAGARLYQGLIPLRGQRQLWERRSELRDSSLVVITDNASAGVPWEVLHLTPPGGGSNSSESFFLGAHGMVRWLSSLNRNPPEQLTARQPRLISPEYTEPADRSGECGYIANRLLGAACTPSYTDVLELLRGNSYDLLHYVGHAANDPGEPGAVQLVLSWRDERGDLHSAALDDQTVAGVLPRPANGAAGPIVFLNACDAGRSTRSATAFSFADATDTGPGGFAGAFLGAPDRPIGADDGLPCPGAGAFVGPLWAINDQPASRFAVEFYETLRRGETMTRAAAMARSAARDDGDPTWMAYSVYAHPFATVDFD